MFAALKQLRVREGVRSGDEHHRLGGGITIPWGILQEQKSKKQGMEDIIAGQLSICSRAKGQEQTQSSRSNGHQFRL